MGSDKALLSLGEQTLLERALRAASQVTTNVRIVGPRSRYETFGEIVEDIYQGCGPLGGIHAALTATDTDLNLVLSVDMPLMSATFLDWLVQQASSGQQLITVPEDDIGRQPLCAIYRKPAVDAIERALKSGEYKMSRMFDKVPTRIITEQQITAAGFSPAIFRNVNTPEEFQELLSATRLDAERGETKRQ
jgi:molybdenum cofactor guanylyltransferase